MSPTISGPETQNGALQQLADDIRNRYRGHLCELRIEVVEGGVVLRGSALSFFGKQIAFHEVNCRCEKPVVANHIEVQSRSG